jgi:AGZA family xanthine/uracil permease-like MFS transporter
MFNQERRTALVSIISAVAAYAIFLNSANKVVWTIFISVVVSTADYLFLQKRRVDLSAEMEEGREQYRMSNEWRFWKKDYWSDFKLIKPTFNLSVLLGALSLVMLNIGANISFGGISASIAGTSQNFDHLSIINSLADIPSALFGGPPIEAIISGTAGAPWPVACGIVFMLVTGILVLVGVIGRLGRYLPSQSIAGFLLVIGFALTFAPNLSAVAQSDNPIGGYMALGVTAWSKNPFLGMVVGILVRYLGAYVGLV